MSTLLQDLRVSVRMLARSRGFAAAAIGIIALASGAGTAVFSLVYSVILRPLPFPSPAQLVSITQFYPTFKENVVTAPVYLDWQDGASRLASMAAYSIGDYTLTGGDTAENVSAARVSPEFFDCLGVRPVTGRTFTAKEAGAVIVSRGFWNGRARRDSLQLDGRVYRVIGEMPASFDFPPGQRLWVPLGLDPVRERSGGPVEMVRVIGRLKPAVTIPGLTAALASISGRVQGFSAGGRPAVVPLRSWLTAKTERLWFVLLGVVVIVLLVACANVAGLLIARGAARRGEMAIRIAIGAPFSRLVRQLLTESLVLSLAGFTVGLGLAFVLVRALLPLVPESMLAGRPVHLDAPVFAVTALTALIIALLFGLAPAREALRTVRRRPLALRSALVAAEVGLSLVLLVCASLMVRSFSALLAVDPGFRVAQTLTFTANLPPRDQSAFLSASLDALRQLPGVRDAAVVSSLPLTTGQTGFALVSAEGEAPWGSPDALRHRVEPVFVSAGYFDAIGTPLPEGRGFAAGEIGASAQSVIVNRAFARRYFAGASALGRRIKIGLVESPEPWRTIVGVVADAKRASLEEDAAPAVYRPYAQRTNLRSAGFVLHTAGDPAALAGAVRRIVVASDVQTMEARLNRSMASQKLRSICAALLALLSLAMVTAGLYGVLSYLVEQRTRELGIRIAVGASPADIFVLVMRRGAVLALTGIAGGGLLSSALSRSLRGLLFGVSPGDPWTLAAASAFLLALALAASLAPARHAIRTDPMHCLRQE